MEECPGIADHGTQAKARARLLLCDFGQVTCL
jgi:hypothetical protein